MEEIWKEISGFEGYRISPEGRLQSCRFGNSQGGFNFKHWRDITGRSRKSGYNTLDLVDVFGNKKSMQLHRLVYVAYIGAIPEGKEIDHIDRDRRNNHYTNLRAATRSQNNYNSKTRSKNPYKGINLCRTGKWVAQTSRGSKTVYLGLYDTAEQAAQAYNDYAIENYGAFAHLNIIPDEVQ